MKSSWSLRLVAQIVGSLIAFAAVCVLPYAFLFGRSMLRHSTVQHFIALSYIWQTLIAAGFAVVAALTGACLLLCQIGQTAELENRRLRNRARALRAALPLALSELSDYAKKCAELNATLTSKQTNGMVQTNGVQFPSLPVGLVADLTDLIEASDENHGRPLIDLIRRVQIQHARALSIQDRATGHNLVSVTTVNNLKAGVLDAAEIFARCSALFEYARGEATTPAEPITFKNVRDAMSLVLIRCPDMTPFEDAFNPREQYSKNDNTWPLWTER